MTKLMRWSWVSNGKIDEIHPPQLLVPSFEDIYKVTKTLKFKCLFGVKLEHNCDICCEKCVFSRKPYKDTKLIFDYLLFIP